MTTKVKWNQQQCMQHITNKLEKGFDRLGSVGVQAVKYEITALGLVKTGNLKDSISHNNLGVSCVIGSEIQPSAGAVHSYAYWLEFGSSQRQARPYMRPAIFRNAKVLLEALVK